VSSFYECLVATTFYFPNGKKRKAGDIPRFALGWGYYTNKLDGCMRFAIDVGGLLVCSLG